MSLLWGDTGNPDLIDIYSPYYNPATGKMETPAQTPSKAQEVPIIFILVGIFVLIHFLGGLHS